MSKRSDSHKKVSCHINATLREALIHKDSYGNRMSPIYILRASISCDTGIMYRSTISR